MTETATDLVVRNKNPHEQSVDLPPQFQAMLSDFPSSTQEAFHNLPDQIKKTVLAFNNSHARGSPEKSYRTWMGMIVQVGTQEDLEEFAREARHDRGIWTTEELADMDSVQREIIARMSSHF